ncbi:hypothetical protein AVEN_165385-1 [Araneus ventricosus]|uniref:Uncharacterized protein n=1 Tax=Araneus ventricosus TaxID=182803 RepID=A0A4Y2ATM2_ARAVE|nr:hypothetical protein AVEN_165385-1 [Araneus ventricosus]
MTRLTLLLSKCPHYTSRTAFGPDGVSAQQTAYTAALRWNWVSRLEPSGPGPEPETFLPGHHGPPFSPTRGEMELVHLMYIK